MPTETGASTGAERAQEHHDAMHNRDLLLVRIGVPAEDAQRIRD